MDGARNLLLSTCKERNLRKVDPNIEDENHTFMASTLSSQGYANEDPVHSWTDTLGDISLTGDSPNLPNRQYTVLRFGSTYTERQTPSYLQLKSNKIFNLVDTNELYVRMLTHWDGAVSRPSGEMSVLNLVSDFGTHFDFSFVIDSSISSGTHGFLKLKCKDRSGADGEYISPTIMHSNNRIELKIFFYVDHIHFEATQYGINIGDPISVDIPYAGLPRNKDATFTIGRNLQTQSQYRGFVTRLGFGRDIDSRPPIPTS